MKKVYSTTRIGEAEMLQVVLRKHGIESRLENEGGALYAVGVPSAAAPIVIVVDDERAEEAARIIAEEFRKPKTTDPTALQVQMRCSCGKTLEYPKGEDPPDECPWCGRPTQFSAAPEASAPHGPPSSKASAAAIVVIVLLLGVVFMALRDKIGKPDPRSNGSEPTQAEWTRRLRQRIDVIPRAEIPRIDPATIAAPLLKEFPEEGARFAAALQEPAGVDALIERWNRLSIELSPDWAMDHGFADSGRLTRYTIRADKVQILMNALALKRLRTIQSSPPSLDGRLHERYLERILLQHLIFGSGLSDPRAAYWGVQASYWALDRPALLAERLEQVPEVVREIRQDLDKVPRLWFDPAAVESNNAMALLRDIEAGAVDERLKAAVIKARQALAEYGSHLRKLQQDNATTAPRDPRWLHFLMRDVEFSGRSPRDVAMKLLAEAEQALPKWTALAGRHQPVTSSYTFEEWRQELQRQTARARDLTLEHQFVEVPPGELPSVRRSPYPGARLPEWPAYAARSFEATLQATLWTAPWEHPEAKSSCAPGTALLAVMGETFPGRHLQTLLSRRDGTLIRRLYWSDSTAEGWPEYCRRWAVGVAPSDGYDRSYPEGLRYLQGWTGAVEICYLAGTLTEHEALEMIRGGLDRSEEQAKSEIAWWTLDPLFSVNRMLGEEDLTKLRNELQAKQGAAFDLKRFHTRLLGYGHTPVALIREELLRDPK